MRSSWIKYISGFYWILLIAVCVLFFAIQSIFYDPYSHKYFDVHVLTEDAHAVLDDGTRVPIEIKHDCYMVESAKANKVSRVEVTLPKIEAANLAVSLLSNEQSIAIYIDEKLRNTYDDTTYHVLSNNSSSNVVSTFVTPEDSGKTLRIEYFTPLSGSAKILGCARIGTELDFYCWLLSKTIGQVISGILLLVFGTLLLMFGFYFRMLHRDDRGLTPLGMYSFLMGIWLFTRSNLRSFYLSHIGSGETMSYFILMLAPVPVLMFFNVLLQRKYEKLFAVMIAISIFNLAIEGFLHIAGVINVLEYPWITQILIVIVCILCLVMTIRYQMHNKIENSSFIVIGLLGFMFSIASEDIGRIVFHAQFVGNFLGFGMLFFLFMISYSAVKNLLFQEQEYQDALRKNEVKSAFLANMSHEIRTPINTILGMDEMILRENENAEIQRYAYNIQHAGKNLLSLINDILDFTKIESGKMEILSQKYDLNKILGEVIEESSFKAKEKSLTFQFHIDSRIPCLLLGDEIKITQILTNLLTNAVKYTPKGLVSLDVSFEKKTMDDIELIFIVTDTGIGIKREDQEKLFESFVRVDEDQNRSIEGSGLGLAITHEIVEMMGGSLSLESEYGWGTTFCARIPQKVIEEIPVGDFTNLKNMDYQRPRELTEHYLATNLELLVVDDNDMNVEVICGLLKNTGISIDTADSGKACLEMVAKKQYDLIFLDHMMPQMDGIETLKRMNQMGDKVFSAPVIALTANAITGAKEEYLKCGFEGYIAKPVDYKTLIETIAWFVPDKIRKIQTKDTATYEGISYLEQNGINVKNALQYSGNDMEQYLHLLEMFVSERAKQRRNTFAEAYQEENWKDYTVAVHSLKNNARTIGADALADFALEHELQCKTGNYAYIEENFMMLRKDWQKTVDVVEQYLQTVKHRAENRPEPEQSKMDKNEWESYKKEVIHAIECFKRSEAVRLLEEILKREGVDRVKLREVLDDINTYEYERAIEHLNNI